MKILFLVRDAPSATGSGYKKRNYYLAKRLSGQKNVSLEIRSPDARQKHSGMTWFFSMAFRLLMSFFSPIPYAARIRENAGFRKKLADYVRQNNIDMVICDGIHQSLNIPLDNQAKKVLYEHNVESEIVRRYAVSENNVFIKAFVYSQFRKFISLQKKMWQLFDSVICCSQLDKEIMLKIVPAANIKVIPNGVDINYFSPNSYQPQPYTLIYIGQIGWKPNEDALLYFSKEIYPLIRKKQPETKFLIVGNKPSREIRDLAFTDSSIEVTGFVEDVRGYINKARVYVAPIRIGSGTRLKILEALSMGKPVVSTSIGCEGLDVENGKNIIIRDTPGEFADAVLELFTDEAKCKMLGVNGRRLMEEKYDWEKIFRSDTVENIILG